MSSPSALPDLSTRDIAVELFGGQNLELSPPDCPDGVSPENQDMVFVPGSTQSRPCLRKILTNAIPGGPTIQSLKTYQDPAGNIFNLVLDVNGKLWQEDVFNTPGTLTQIGTVAAGSYFKSVTLDGVEYLAFSDGIHGTDIPRQWNGTNLDRVSQDGPGAGPTLTNYTLPAQSLVSPGASAPVSIATITPTDPTLVLVGNDGGLGGNNGNGDILLIDSGGDGGGGGGDPVYVTYYQSLTVATSAVHG